MAEVDIIVGGRSYRLACDDGQEPRLRALASRIDDIAKSFGPGAAQLSEPRLLLMCALMTADKLDEAENAAAEARAAPEPDPQQALFAEDAVRDAARNVDDAAARIRSLASRRKAASPSSASEDRAPEPQDADASDDTVESDADDAKPLTPFQRRALKRARLQAKREAESG